MSDTTCKSCWWQEGGLCYTGRFERDENGRSNKKADKPCGLHSSKRKMLEKYFDGNKLIIMSEENK